MNTDRKSRAMRVKELAGKATEGKTFPIMGLMRIPWHIAEMARMQAEKNHGQTLERLAGRGGLDSKEFFFAWHGKRLFDTSVDRAEADEFIRQCSVKYSVHVDAAALADDVLALIDENERLKRRLSSITCGDCDGTELQHKKHCEFGLCAEEKHLWVSTRTGGAPDDPSANECVAFCKRCGAEKSDG